MLHSFAKESEQNRIDERPYRNVQLIDIAHMMFETSCIVVNSFSIDFVYICLLHEFQATTQFNSAIKHKTTKGRKKKTVMKTFLYHIVF